jgi:hypothetical protein
MQQTNPLNKHFRQPAIFLKLPSGGKYWAPNSIELSANGEIGVMPMTTKDEILLRTPDALMNGQGVVDVIQSCVPAIKNAWAMPTIDSDAILIAIRIATYGDQMDMDSKCVHCNHENRHGLQLSPVLLSLRSPDYSKTLNHDNLVFKFNPLNYIQSTKNNVLAFEQQKILDLISTEDIDPDVRKAQFDIHLQNIIDSNINILTLSTESIKTEEGSLVTDKQFIAEFYNNASNRTIKVIQEHLTKLTTTTKLKPAKVLCESCEKEYSVEFGFDYSNFLEPLS